jgi:hypothetical protein
MKKTLDHGMLLDAKRILDNALPTLYGLRELVPEKLQDQLNEVLAAFERDLVECDVSNDYRFLGEWARLYRES